MEKLENREYPVFGEKKPRIVNIQNNEGPLYLKSCHNIDNRAQVYFSGPEIYFAQFW